MGLPDLRAQIERIVYDCTGERIMLPDLPYQRKLIDRFEAMVRAAVEAEREACAKVADAGFGPESCCPGIATAIRARKP